MSEVPLHSRVFPPLPSEQRTLQNFKHLYMTLSRDSRRALLKRNEFSQEQSVPPSLTKSIVNSPNTPWEQYLPAFRNPLETLQTPPPHPPLRGWLPPPPVLGEIVEVDDFRFSIFSFPDVFVTLRTGRPAIRKAGGVRWVSPQTPPPLRGWLPRPSVWGLGFRVEG